MMEFAIVSDVNYNIKHNCIYFCGTLFFDKTTFI